jgi:hypothetical protein
VSAALSLDPELDQEPNVIMVGEHREARSSVAVRRRG